MDHGDQAEKKPEVIAKIEALESLSYEIFSSLDDLLQRLVPVTKEQVNKTPSEPPESDGVFGTTCPLGHKLSDIGEKLVEVRNKILRQIEHLEI